MNNIEPYDLVEVMVYKKVRHGLFKHIHVKDRRVCLVLEVGKKIELVDMGKDSVYYTVYPYEIVYKLTKIESLAYKLGVKTYYIKNALDEYMNEL